MELPEDVKDPSQLESLAEYLHDKQDAILAQWRDAVKKEEDEQVSILDSLSESKFYDSIPEFLEQLRNRLRGEDSHLSQVARGHGAQRWEHSLDLQEVVNEWSQLHFIIMDQVYQSQESISISQASLEDAQRLLNRFIHEGIRASIEEYYRLLRKEAEGKMKILEQVVQEKDQLTEQRSKTLQETSHDMKGSMTALHINLNLLEQADLSDQVMVREYVKKLSGAAENLIQMLKNLLDLSRLEAGQEEPEINQFDAAELLRSLSETMRPYADSKKLDLRTQGSEELVVRGDRLKVQRIAQNLLLNALKYTQEGYVEVTWQFTSSDRWQFGIRDTGPGMDFKQAPSPSKNTSDSSTPAGPRPEEMEDEQNAQFPIKSEGIGLFIVRRLCEVLDGVIDFESEEGVGTHIRVTFPRDYSAD